MEKILTLFDVGSGYLKFRKKRPIPSEKMAYNHVIRWKNVFLT